MIPAPLTGPLKKLSVLFLLVPVFFWGYLITNTVPRVWVDEVWVVLNPAFRLLSGEGYLNPDDWETGIRSWLPPILYFIPLKAFALLGLKSPVFAHRALLTFQGVFTLTAFGLFLRAMSLSSSWGIGLLAILACVPEVARHCLSADLSAIALPFLLVAFWFRLHKKNQQLALLFFVLAALIRYQLAVVPFVLLVYDCITEKNVKPLRLYFPAFVGALLFDFWLNSAIYKYPIVPIFRYYSLNLFQHKAAEYGVTPFYFAFELMWRFCSEPLFILGLLSSFYFLYQKKMQDLIWANFALFGSHMLVGHKEFRFFLIPAVLFSGIALAGVAQIWNRRKKGGRITAGILLTIVCAALFWRANSKTDFHAFDMPSKLIERAGTMPEVKGLIVVGWGGIKNGGQYTFYKSAPYFYGEDLKAVREKALNLSQYSHFIAPSSLGLSCQNEVQNLDGAKLYECSQEELRKLFR